MYQDLTGAESVHLAAYPAADESLISDAVEKPMDLVRDLVSLGRSAREDAKIKVRQPLTKVIIDGEYKTVLGDLTELLKEELNVKLVDFEDDLQSFLNFTVKPNFKVAGPILGSKVKLLGKAMATVDAAALVAATSAGKAYPVEVEGETIDVTPEMVDVRIAAKDGFDVQTDGEHFVILDMTLTDTLIAEGIARECVSKVQQMRKNHDFEVTDHIVITYEADAEAAQAIEANADFIKKETLAEDLKAGTAEEEQDLNGHAVKLTVERV